MSKFTLSNNLTSDKDLTNDYFEVKKPFTNSRSPSQTRGVPHGQGIPRSFACSGCSPHAQVSKWEWEISRNINNFVTQTDFFIYGAIWYRIIENGGEPRCCFPTVDCGTRWWAWTSRRGWLLVDFSSRMLCGRRFMALGEDRLTPPTLDRLSWMT